MKHWMQAFAAVLLSFAAWQPFAVKAQPSPPIADARELPIATLVDVTSGQVLFARNADRRFVPASITKVMTLFHAFELIDAGQLDPNESLVMSDDVWRDWHGEGSTMWIDAGDQIPVSDLLTGIANISANDASIVLAEGQAGSVSAWLDGMNERARGEGMTSSHFGTPNGWPDEGVTFTTASDLLRLGKAIMTRHPDKVARYMGKSGFRYNGIQQRNRDPLIGRVEGADGLKTGYTNESGFGYLGTAERNGQRLMLVVAGAERGFVRDNSARALMEWGFDTFDRELLFAEGIEVGQARVQGGNSRQVGLRTQDSVYVNVPAGRAGDLVARVEYDGPIRAPFKAGDRIATLVIEVPGMEPAHLPLLAQQSVDEASFVDRILNGIVGWFS